MRSEFSFCVVSIQNNDVWSNSVNRSVFFFIRCLEPLLGDRWKLHREASSLMQPIFINIRPLNQLMKTFFPHIFFFEKKLNFCFLQIFIVCQIFFASGFLHYSHSICFLPPPFDLLLLSLHGSTWSLSRAIMYSLIDVYFRKAKRGLDLMLRGETFCRLLIPREKKRFSQHGNFMRCSQQFTS